MSTARPVKVVPRRLADIDQFADAPPASPKRGRLKNGNWLTAVRQLEFCVKCGRYGVQAAHRNEGKGMGMKVSDCLTAALCSECHTEIDNGKTMTREERRQAMNDAILKTLEALVRAGKVGVIA